MAHHVLLCTVFLLFSAVFVTAIPRRVQMVASCEGKNFCTKKPDDYPLEKFQMIMQDMPLRAVEVKELEYRQFDTVVNEMDIVCPKKSYYFHPIYQIVDTAGDVRYVAQIPDVFVQKHSLAECQRPGRVHYPHGGKVFGLDNLEEFNVTCVETRVDHKFLVLSHDGDRVEVASVLGDVPVGCVCRYSYLD